LYIKIYDGSNAESLILFELSSTNYNIVLNKTIASTGNIVFIRLKAGHKTVGGIRFLLFWTQIDGLYLNELYPLLENNSKFKFKYIILNYRHKNNMVLCEYNELKKNKTKKQFSILQLTVQVLTIIYHLILIQV